MKKKMSTTTVVLIGMFAALTFLGTMIKIPMPTGDFIHLGNSVVLLAILLLGFLPGALAGSIGFVLFDLLNGFAAEAPYFILECFVVSATATFIRFLFHHQLKHMGSVLIVSLGAVTAKLLMTQCKNVLIGMVAGADFPAAFLGALAKIPATAINAVGTVMIVTLTFFPLKKALDSIMKIKQY